MVQFAPTERNRSIDESQPDEQDPRKKSLAELSTKPFSRYKVRVKSASGAQMMTRNISGASSTTGARRGLTRPPVFCSGSQVSFNVPRGGMASNTSLRTPPKM